MSHRLGGLHRFWVMRSLARCACPLAAAWSWSLPRAEHGRRGPGGYARQDDRHRVRRCCGAVLSGYERRAPSGCASSTSSLVPSSPSGTHSRHLVFGHDAGSAPRTQRRAGPRPLAEPVPSAGRPPALTSRKVKRNRRLWLAGLVLLSLALAFVITRGSGRPSASGRGRNSRGHHQNPPPHLAGNPRLDPDWQGDGQPVTFAFGGDVHFPVGTNLGDRLAADPSTALGPTVPQLLSGANLSMVNFESAMTADGSCPDAQPKQYVFSAPPSAVERVPGRRRHPHHRGQQPRRGLRSARPPDGPHHPRRRPATPSSASEGTPRRPSPRTPRPSGGSGSPSSRPRR